MIIILEDYMVSRPSRKQLEVCRRLANCTGSYTDYTGIKRNWALRLGRRAVMKGASSSSTWVQAQTRTPCRWTLQV